MRKYGEVKRRDEVFSDKVVTHIWQETASDGNPYIAESCMCYGYDLFDLVAHKKFVDVFFLLFRGDLPSQVDARKLEALMVAMINPGPRHPAARAAMSAGIGKTHTTQILPVSLTILAGQLGAAAVEDAMRFLRKERRRDPGQVAEEILLQTPSPPEGDWLPVPGFGTRFGGIDLLPQKIADLMLSLPGANANLEWGNLFAEKLNQRGLGWLSTGVAAAVFADLGFHPRFGPGLFQLICAPGLLAHGLEVANKPLTAMPFIRDEDYVIER